MNSTATSSVLGTIVKFAFAGFILMDITGWGQPPLAGDVLFPTDRGLIGNGIARNPTIAKQQASEDASQNRFMSVRFETFMQGMGYAYSFKEFAIDEPARSYQVSVVDSIRVGRADASPRVHLHQSHCSQHSSARSSEPKNRFYGCSYRNPSEGCVLL